MSVLKKGDSVKQLWWAWWDASVGSRPYLLKAVEDLNLAFCHYMKLIIYLYSQNVVKCRAKQTCQAYFYPTIVLFLPDFFFIYIYWWRCTPVRQLQRLSNCQCLWKQLAAIKRQATSWEAEKEQKTRKKRKGNYSTERYNKEVLSIVSGAEPFTAYC